MSFRLANTSRRNGNKVHLDWIFHVVNVARQIVMTGQSLIDGCIKKRQKRQFIRAIIVHTVWKSEIVINRTRRVCSNHWLRKTTWRISCRRVSLSWRKFALYRWVLCYWRATLKHRLLAPSFLHPQAQIKSFILPMHLIDARIEQGRKL